MTDDLHALTLRISVKMYEPLRTEAFDRRMPISDVIREAVDEHLTRRFATPPADPTAGEWRWCSACLPNDCEHERIRPATTPPNDDEPWCRNCKDRHSIDQSCSANRRLRESDPATPDDDDASTEASEPLTGRLTTVSWEEHQRLCALAVAREHLRMADAVTAAATKARAEALAIVKRACDIECKSPGKHTGCSSHEPYRALLAGSRA